MYDCGRIAADLSIAMLIILFIAALLSGGVSAWLLWAAWGWLAIPAAAVVASTVVGGLAYGLSRRESAARTRAERQGSGRFPEVSRHR